MVCFWIFLFFLEFGINDEVAVKTDSGKQVRKLGVDQGGSERGRPWWWKKYEELQMAKIEVTPMNKKKTLMKLNIESKTIETPLNKTKEVLMNNQTFTLPTLSKAADLFDIFFSKLKYDKVVLDRVIIKIMFLNILEDFSNREVQDKTEFEKFLKTNLPHYLDPSMDHNVDPLFSDRYSFIVTELIEAALSPGAKPVQTSLGANGELHTQRMETKKPIFVSKNKLQQEVPVIQEIVKGKILAKFHKNLLFKMTALSATRQPFHKKGSKNDSASTNIVSKHPPMSFQLIHETNNDKHPSVKSQATRMEPGLNSEQLLIRPRSALQEEKLISPFLVRLPTQKTTYTQQKSNKSNKHTTAKHPIMKKGGTIDKTTNAKQSILGHSFIPSSSSPKNPSSPTSQTTHSNLKISISSNKKETSRSDILKQVNNLINEEYSRMQQELNNFLRTNLKKKIIQLISLYIFLKNHDRPLSISLQKL